MNCKNCKREIEKNQLFCTNCGTKVQIIKHKNRYIFLGTGILGIVLLLVVVFKLSMGFIDSKDLEVNEVVSERTLSKHKITEEQVIQAQLSVDKEDWIYFDDMNDSGKLFRMKTDGSSKMALPVTNIENWCIYDDKIIYSTLRDWTEVYQSYDEKAIPERFFINQLYIMDLDGANSILIADEFSPLYFDTQENLAITFNPLFIREDKIYFEVTAGIPETDAMWTSIYRVNKDMTNFQQLSDQFYFYMSEYYLSDKYLYFSDNYMEQLSPLNRIDLISGQSVEIGDATNLLGEYKGELYYTEAFWSSSETNISLHKLRVNSIESEQVCELSDSAYLVYATIINNKLYYSYYQEGVYDSSGLIKKELDLDTGKILPIAPGQEEYLYMPNQYRKVQDQDGWIYYTPYDEENYIKIGIHRMNYKTQQNQVVEAGVNVNQMQIVQLETVR